VSTRDQEREGYSIPAQIKLLEDYAAINGLMVMGNFVDVETARKAGRTAFGEMLRELRRNPGIRALLVEKTDRLYRNIKDWATIDELGIEVHFVKENFVLSDQCRSSEKFMHGIKVLMAKSYIDNLSEEVSKGMSEKARQGEWPSYAPIGYENVIGSDRRKTVVVDPRTASLISLLFEWFASGTHSLVSVTEQARAAGLVGRKRGQPIGVGTVHRILRSSFYTGTFEWAGETYSGTHEPLVTIALWQAVQDILDRRASSNVRVTPHKFPFSGLIKCGHCGCAVVAHMAKGRYAYYRCSGYRGKCPERYVREEVIAEKFVSFLRQLECSDREFDAVKSALGLEGRCIAAGGRASSVRTLKRPDVPGAFMREGIGLLDVARGARNLLPALSAEGKRQILGLISSGCTWVNGDLNVTFGGPFALFAKLLREYSHLDADDRSTSHFAPLRDLFHDPSPGTRQLIARYNAMVDLTWEIGRAKAPVRKPGEFELERI
jgi:site-specific DNA recombinase